MIGDESFDFPIKEELWYPPVKIPFEGTGCSYFGERPAVLLTTDDSWDLNGIDAVKSIAPLLVDCYQISGKLMARTMAEAIIAMWLTIGSACYEEHGLHDYPSKKQQVYITDRWLKVHDRHYADAYVHVSYSDTDAMWVSEFFYQARGYHDLEIGKYRFRISVGRLHAMRADYVELVWRTNRLRNHLDTSWLPQYLMI